MVERGGTATQAGIEYQNHLAALYMGDLLRFDDEGRDRVIEVRVEAPAPVDDIVVRYADHKRRWIQAKLTLKQGEQAWHKLWADFRAQLSQPSFGPEDRLGLAIGTPSPLALALKACATATFNSNLQEWDVRLTVGQRKIVEGVISLVGDQAFKIFQLLDVEILTLDMVKSDEAHRRMPPSNVTSAELLNHLCVAAGGGAKKRGVFNAPELRQALHSLRVELDPPARWGLSAYLQAIDGLRVAVPGVAVGGPAAETFVWPRTSLTDEVHGDFDNEQRLDAIDRHVSDLDLRLFPTPRYAQCIVHAGPGFGKTALLRALAQTLGAAGVRVPVIVPLGALAEGDRSVIDYLQKDVNAEYAVNIDWMRLCETGAAVVLFDGLDELDRGRRADIVGRVTRFTARLPDTPWMMTVRDPGVVPGDFNAPKIELLPLARQDMATLARSLRPNLAPGRIDALLDQIEAYPDLARLVKIPLFLALRIATWRPGEPVPRQRGDLLETYLKTLFRPEEFKTSLPAVDAERLRRALQDLAFSLLERGEIGAPERQVRGVLATHAGDGVTGDQLFDDAVRMGLLGRVTSTRLAFPFPIVQEYLAAQELVVRFPEQIAVRAQRAVERPWAQMVQFALEELPDASTVVQDMLGRPEDAFSTTTRLVARCILNGMSCTPKLRADVGDRLARAWPKQGFWTCRAIGQMLIDGWVQPLSPALRLALHRRKLLSDGGAEILARLADSELTLSALRSFLKNPSYLAHLWDFQPAVTAVSPEAFELYVEASRTIDDHRDWALAGLILRLDPTAISAARLVAVANDGSLTRGIRLAAWGLQGIEPDALYWDLADTAFASDMSSDHWAAIKALRRIPQPGAELQKLLRRSGLSEKALYSIVEHLQDVLVAPDQRQAFIGEETARGDLPDTLRFRLLFQAATMRDRTAYDQLLVELNDRDIEDFGPVILVLNHFRDKAHGDRIVTCLRGRLLTGKEQVSLAADLMTGANYVSQIHSFGGGASLTATMRHPSYADFVSLIAEWREVGPFELDERLRLETIAARERIPGAIEMVERLARRVILEEDVRGMGNPLNSTIRSAIEELARQRRPLELAVAIHLVKNSDSNAHLGALYHLASIGTQEALDYMLELHAEDAADRMILFEGLETLSGRLALRIVEADGRLQAVAQGDANTA